MISIKKHDSLHYLLYIFILSQSVLVELPWGLAPLPLYQRHVNNFPISATQIFASTLSAEHASVLPHT